MKLTQLIKAKTAIVTGVNDGINMIGAKLREIGFAEGDEVEIMHYGPLGATPICVRLNRTLIALRPEEAAQIEVELKNAD